MKGLPSKWLTPVRRIRGTPLLKSETGCTRAGFFGTCGKVDVSRVPTGRLCTGNYREAWLFEPGDCNKLRVVRGPTFRRGII